MRYRAEKIFYVLLIFLLILNLSMCRWFSNSLSVTVVFPEIPDQWINGFDACGFTVIYPGLNGKLQKKTVSSGIKTTVIDLEKSTNIPVLSCLSEGLLPAGGFFPLNLNEQGELILSWNNGFSANLIIPLFLQGSAVDAINIERLTSGIQEKAEGDPWSLNADSIKMHLSYGSFRADIIKKLPVNQIILSAEQGIWVSSNPFMQEFPVIDKDGLAIENIYPGFFSFYRAGSSEIIYLYITEIDWYYINPFRGDTGYGTW